MIVRQGIDPVEAQREMKRKEKALNVSAYCDFFVDLYLQPHWPDTWPEAMRTLENVIKPRWGKRSLLSLKRADMVKLMDDYAERPGRKKYVHSLLRKMFNWAVDREDIEISPLAGMKAPKAVASRRRVLGQTELVCLRRTGATNLEALGIPIKVTEAVLNHISGTRAGVAGIYYRYKYEPKKRAVPDAWDQRLQERVG